MRAVAWTWICISPLLFVMAAISTVQSLTVYYVQLACFGAVAVMGLLGGIALLLGRPVGRKILSGVSWLGFGYFTLAAAFIVPLHILRGPEVSVMSIGVTSLLAAAIAAPGLFFLAMTRKLRNAQPAAQPDAAPPHRLT
ncbi:MAG: hypothetical protein F9K13_03390 [Candidatus Methylomirabilis oxygeniifera]|uniref:Uncharacterized protein n=1 Tax=Methylomirabilis oxygeniifera TaxID=671143 RepID=D5MFM0_METO1|nr:MAG: hypothetical protein F9K13_03390 [Candidatus Methylomirabilis oxyfera]CBE68551.1 membrane protein of unknown function [Candidatus Methylomirabilis oxyfera]